MLDAGQILAIARIDLVDAQGDAEQRGTGALVHADGLVLTAAHVVADRAAAAPLAGTLRLVFGRPGKTAVHETTATIERLAGAGAHDWALLRCTNAPPATPFRLHPLDGDGAHVRWETFGFSATYRTAGGFYAGRVRARDGEDLELEAAEIGAAPDAPVGGLSGSPCLLESTGALIGVIRAAGTLVDGVNLAATLRAVPIETIVAEYGLPCPLSLDSDPLPYQDVFESKLRKVERPALESLADKVLGLARPYKEDLARRIARALIRGRLFTVVDALKTLGTEIAAHEDMLRSLAETLWVHERPARRLAGLVERPLRSRAAAINATKKWTAEHYLCRACAHRHGNEPFWHEQSVEVLNVHGGEWQADQLLDAIRGELADRFVWESDDAIRAGVKNVETFVVVKEPTPRASVLAAVEDAFPGIHLVLLTHPALPEVIRQKAPDLDYLVPELEAGQEQRVASDCRAALERLHPVKKKRGRSS